MLRLLKSNKSFRVQKPFPQLLHFLLSSMNSSKAGFCIAAAGIIGHL
jgi:hypothetical protein